MNILVVDDDPMIIEMLTFKLTERGYTVDSVMNGWSALLKLSKNKYDLLVTDLMMPDISGLTLLSLLKNYTFESIPIIIITSLDHSTTILSGFGLGAQEYFVKPLNMDLFLATVERLTKKVG
ncbi:MAG TPA: response regulator transcription factor [Bacteroidia bacterium]|nr:response regulator transcription factor [Bacteroidia bacterium]